MGELNNSYEDAQLSDCIIATGCNSYETQTNYFLNHWLPNLNGGTVDKKKKWFPGETAAAGGGIRVEAALFLAPGACASAPHWPRRRRRRCDQRVREG